MGTTAKGEGWDVGVRTTVAAPATEVWTFLLGAGLPLWLGQIDALPVEKGSRYVTADGVAGTIVSYTEGARVRLSWRPDDWPHDTELRLAIKESAMGTSIAIHHELLADRDERRMMLGHWKNVAAALDAHFA